MVATDISEEALELAHDNAETHDLRQVQFLLGNWFEPLAGRTFDLVLSNPPYIAKADPALTDPALQHEPQIAPDPGRRRHGVSA